MPAEWLVTLLENGLGVYFFPESFRESLIPLAPLNSTDEPWLCLLSVILILRIRRGSGPR